MIQTYWVTAGPSRRAASSLMMSSGEGSSGFSLLQSCMSWIPTEGSSWLSGKRRHKKTQNSWEDKKSMIWLQLWCEQSLQRKPLRSTLTAVKENLKPVQSQNRVFLSSPSCEICCAGFSSFKLHTVNTEETDSEVMDSDVSMLTKVNRVGDKSLGFLHLNLELNLLGDLLVGWLSFSLQSDGLQMDLYNPHMWTCSRYFSEIYSDVFALSMWTKHLRCPWRSAHWCKWSSFFCLSSAQWWRHSVLCVSVLLMC